MEKVKTIFKAIFIIMLLVLLVGIYISLYNLQTKQKNIFDKVTSMYNKESEQISYLAKNNYEELYNQIARLKSKSADPYYLNCKGSKCDLMKFDYEKREGVVIFENIKEEIRKFEGVAAGVSDKGPVLIGMIDDGNIMIENTYYDVGWSKTVIYEVGVYKSSIYYKTILKIGEARKEEY